MWISRMCALALLYALYNVLIAALSVALRGADAAGLDATVRTIGAVLVLMLVLVLDGPRTRLHASARAVIIDHALLATIVLATGISAITEQHFIEPVGVIVAVVAMVGLQPAAPVDVALACGGYAAWFVYLLIYMRVYPRLLAASLYAVFFVAVCAVLHLLWKQQMRAHAEALRQNVANMQHNIQLFQQSHERQLAALRPSPLMGETHTSLVAIVGVVRAHRPLHAHLAQQLVTGVPWVRVLAIDDVYAVFYADSDATALRAAQQLQALTDGAVRLSRTTLTLRYIGVPFVLGVRWGSSEEMLERMAVQPPGVQHDATIVGALPTSAASRRPPPTPPPTTYDLGALSAPSAGWPLVGAPHRVAVTGSQVRYVSVDQVPHGWANFASARAEREADVALRWALVGAVLLALSAVFDLALAPTRAHMALWFGVAPAVVAVIGAAAWLWPAGRPRLRPLWLLAVYALTAASSFGMPYRTTRLLVAQSYAALYVGVNMRTAIAIHAAILVAACTLAAVDASAFASAYTIVYTLTVAAIGVTTAVVEQRAAEMLFCLEHEVQTLEPQSAHSGRAMLELNERYLGVPHAAALQAPVVFEHAVVVALVDVAEESLLAIDAVMTEALVYRRIAYRPVSGTLLYQRTERRAITGAAHADLLAQYARELGAHCGGIGAGAGELHLAVVGSATTALLPLAYGGAVSEAIAAAMAARTEAL